MEFKGFIRQCLKNKTIITENYTNGILTSKSPQFQVYFFVFYFIFKLQNMFIYSVMVPYYTSIMQVFR